MYIYHYNDIYRIRANSCTGEYCLRGHHNIMNLIIKMK